MSDAGRSALVVCTPMRPGVDERSSILPLSTQIMISTHWEGRASYLNISEVRSIVYKDHFIDHARNVLINEALTRFRPDCYILMLDSDILLNSGSCIEFLQYSRTMSNRDCFHVPYCTRDGGLSYGSTAEGHPWVAGGCTLYGPRFFRKTKRCRWFDTDGAAFPRFGAFVGEDVGICVRLGKSKTFTVSKQHTVSHLPGR